MAITLKHQTLPQFAERFWRTAQRHYKAGKAGSEIDLVLYCKMIWWIYQRISAGDVTSEQVRQSYNSFYGKSLNSTQWNNLVTSQFIPARDRYQAILDQGEI